MKFEDFLDDIDLSIRDNLSNFLNRKGDEVFSDRVSNFSDEDYYLSAKLSFIYNFTELLEEGSNLFSINFNYDDVAINFGYIPQHSHPALKQLIISNISQSQDFLNLFKSFLRDKKIENIIDE